MGLTLDTCNMNLKQCCANRILFLCVKHQLLVHISSSGISSWKILDESQGVESFEKQHSPSDIQGEVFKPPTKTPNLSLQSGNRVNCSEMLQIDKRDQANTGSNRKGKVEMNTQRPWASFWLFFLSSIDFAVTLLPEIIYNSLHSTLSSGPTLTDRW